MIEIKRYAGCDIANGFPVPVKEGHWCSYPETVKPLLNEIASLRSTIAQMKAEIEEYRASKKCKQETVNDSFPIDRAVEMLHKHFDPLWEKDTKGNT